LNVNVRIANPHANISRGGLPPGEAEKAAKLMGLPFKELFKKYLKVDWWVDDQDIFVLSPNVVGHQPGTMADYNPKGKCVFFKKGLCLIHKAKPLECADLNCKEGAKAHDKKSNAHNWEDHQPQIERLLGYEPEAASGNFMDLF